MSREQAIEKEELQSLKDATQEESIQVEKIEKFRRYMERINNNNKYGY